MREVTEEGQHGLAEPKIHVEAEVAGMALRMRELAAHEIQV